MSVATKSPPVIEPEPEAPLTGNLSWLLSQANHAMATEMTARMEGIGIYPRGYCVLMAALYGGLTQTEIAQQIGVDKTTMVVAVDELEKAGLAERVPSKTDRRARVIEVTAAGASKVSEAKTIVHELQQEVLGTLPANERKALISALNRLVGDRLSVPSQCERSVRRRD